MARKLKVVRCPQCTYNIRLPLGIGRSICPRCNNIISHPTQDDDDIAILEETHSLDGEGLDSRSYPLDNVSNDVNQNPAKLVLKVLRSYRADCPQWFSIHKVYYCCIMAGLLPVDVQETIDKLTAEGFIEKRDDAIRAIPIN
ncbi:MAG: hypothetical protein Q6361_04595 [Candidatus Hermodarchaeota archaeon]|nr:hypothetical protein [Candidatus Hermodarchaeota archaeon]